MAARRVFRREAAGLLLLAAAVAVLFLTSLAIGSTPLPIGQVFDVGWYMFHVIGRFLKNDAQVLPFQDGCNTKASCNDIPPTPPARDPATLP